MKQNSIDLRKSFEKMKEANEEPKVYTLGRMQLTGLLALFRNGSPIMLVPEECLMDMTYLISRAMAVDKLFPDKTPDDIPSTLFSGEQERDKDHELLNLPD